MRVASRGFAGPAEFRAWLLKNHATARELFVRCSKAHVAGGVTYRQALDEALCLGWIDGVRHSVDAASFSRSERGEGIPPLQRPNAGKTAERRGGKGRS